MSADHAIKTYFFFQAEDGIRDDLVTGVQTCALPIFNLDYSLMQILPLPKDILLQFGLVGYGQWQTSNHRGPGVNPANPAHYRVNAIGGAANVIIPAKKASVGFKLFKEFSNSSTVQGYSLQILGSITF